MNTTNENILKIEFKDSEIDNLKSIIKKCKSEDKKIGFGAKSFNEDELKLINDINKSI